MTWPARPGAPPGNRFSRPRGATPRNRPRIESLPARHTLSPESTTDVRQPVSAAVETWAAEQDDSAPSLRRYEVAVAVGYGPSGRRQRWLTLVTSCPFCERCHHHYGSEFAPAKGTYRSGCGRIYWLATATTSQYTGRVA